MRRLFINLDNIKGKTVYIDTTQAHHIRDVLRMKVGDKVWGFDGAGKRYLLCIKALGQTTEAEIEAVEQTESHQGTCKILLGCALPKKSKMDYIVEKATELGVSEIIPLVTKRTIVKVDENSNAAKQRRWEKISIEASKQCGRDTLPTIRPAMRFKDAVKIVQAAGYSRMLLATVTQGTRLLTQTFVTSTRSVAVFIGPEGDFSKDETDYAASHGFIPVSLGPRVLRVDTACFFVLSVLQAFMFTYAEIT